MSEQGRINELLQASRRCAALEALEKARRLRGGPGSCGSCGSAAVRPIKEQTALESEVLKERMSRAALCGTQGLSVGPESVRIAAIQECVVNAAPRFSQFRGPFIPPVCPFPFYSAVQYDASGNAYIPSLGGNIQGNMPILQGKVCPLPNKPDNPVLPG